MTIATVLTPPTAALLARWCLRCYGTGRTTAMPSATSYPPAFLCPECHGRGVVVRL